MSCQRGPFPSGHADHQCWVVLDARDGREPARLPLDSAASGSHHLSHPDGLHMGLCVGTGQDGILLHRARRDGGELTGWDLDESSDRILTDVHPGHAGFLTAEHYGADLMPHALDGAVLAEGVPEPSDEEDPPCWDHGCGFVDADTVIASAVGSDEDPDLPLHWMLDARTPRVRDTRSLDRVNGFGLTAGSHRTAPWRHGGSGKPTGPTGRLPHTGVREADDGPSPGTGAGRVTRPCVKRRRATRGTDLSGRERLRSAPGCGGRR
ncbi:hypothetical protein ABZ871_05875 [Streptomyces populi]